MTILKKVQREAQTLLRICNNDMITPTSLTKKQKQNKNKSKNNNKKTPVTLQECNFLFQFGVFPHSLQEFTLLLYSFTCSFIFQDFS